LPDGWTTDGIGDVADFRAESPPKPKSPTRFDVSAKAKGFSGNGDSVFFVCKTNWGDEFQATLQTNKSRGQSVCGIMIRASKDPKSRFWFIGASANEMIFCSRSADKHFGTNSVAIPPVDRSKPITLNFYRQNDQFVANYTFQAYGEPSRAVIDGIGGYAISNNQPPLVGFALFSGNSSDTVEAQFTTTNL
jgi:hypothetical protein